MYSSLVYIQVEEPRQALILSGHKTNQVIKDFLIDVQKLKAVRIVTLDFFLETKLVGRILVLTTIILHTE